MKIETKEFAWNNIGRVFDAAKIRWQNEWFGADFFASKVVIPEDGRLNVNNDYDFFLRHVCDEHEDSEEHF